MSTLENLNSQGNGLSEAQSDKKPAQPVMSDPAGCTESAPEDVFDTVYTPWEELEPLSSCPDECSKRIAEAVKNLGSEDWQQQYHAARDLQAAARHHPQLLLAHMEAVSGGLFALVDCLRSGVAKNAMLCCEYIARGTGDAAHAFGQKLLPRLLSKACSEKAFLADAAQAAGRAFMQAGRVTPALLLVVSEGAHEKNAAVGAAAAVLLEEGIKHAGVLEAEALRGLVVPFAKLLDSRRLDAKQAAKRIVGLVCKQEGGAARLTAAMSEVQVTPSQKRNVEAAIAAAASAGPAKPAARQGGGIREFLAKQRQAAAAGGSADVCMAE